MSETVIVTLGGETVPIIIEGGNLAAGADLSLNDLNNAATRAEQAAADAEAAVAEIPGLVGDKLNSDGSNPQSDFLDNVGAAPKNFAGTVYDGSEQTITTSGTQPNNGIFGWNVNAVNTSPNNGYGLGRATYAKKGKVSGGSNDIGDATISRWEDVQFGFLWNHWDVYQSPLKMGSGLPGAPTGAQEFYVVGREVNPQNRHDQLDTFHPELRSYFNPVLSDQYVPETQDFTGLLGSTRPGFNVVCSTSTSRSPYTDTTLVRHAQTLVPNLILPNAVAHAGYGTFATGHRPFVVSITQGNLGTGYKTGDILLSNTGLFAYDNEEFYVRVTLAVSGMIISYELLTAGSFQGAVTNPVSMTGGSGTGATFNVTLSTRANEEPVAWAGVGGHWGAGISGLSSEAGLASFTNGLLHMPVGTKFAVARRTDNVDVEVLAFGSNNRTRLGGREFTPPADYTPVVTSETGTIGGITSLSGRWWITNGLLHYNIQFNITSAGTGGQAIRATLPSGFTPAIGSASNAIRNSDMQVLSAFVPAAATYVRIAAANGTSPIVTDGFYLITGFVEL